MAKKHPFPGELALLAGLVLNSFAVTMIVKSALGLSVVSGVPYVLSIIWPRLSMGTWNTIIQCAWMVLIIVIFRSFRPGYVLSFGLAVLFGYMLNFWAWAFAPLPDTLAFRLLWFALGYVTMSFGIAFFIRCKLPVLPFDTVPRAFILRMGWSVRATRTGFDLINLALMLGLGLIFLGYPAGIGVGTVVNALLMGSGSGYAVSLLDKHMDIQPRIHALAKLT